jgi:preprotein translocase subunit SecE
VRSAFSCFEDIEFFIESEPSVAKTSPSEFFNQVRAEASKIVWPSSRETMMTTVMVVIMTATLGIFFFGIDTFFGWVVRMLLSLAAGTAN